MNIYARYHSERYISYWRVYKTRRLLWDKCIAKFEVINGEDIHKVYKRDVVPYIELVKEMK